MNFGMGHLSCELFTKLIAVKDNNSWKGFIMSRKSNITQFSPKKGSVEKGGKPRNLDVINNTDYSIKIRFKNIICKMHPQICMQKPSLSLMLSFNAKS
ncbi:hypothetical protein MASR2M48_26370 [Spirochaetota bacterium]